MAWNEDGGVSSPEHNAGFFSRITFWWFNPMIKLAIEKRLSIDDLPDTPIEYSAETLCSIIESSWEKVRKPSQGKERKTKVPNNTLLSLITKRFFWPAFIGCLGWIISSLARVAALILLQQLMTRTITDGKFHTYMLAVGLSICSLVECFSIHFSFYYTMCVVLKIRIALIMLLYKKMLNLRLVDLQNATTGEIINLFSNDIAVFNERCRMLSGVVVGPIFLAINAAILWWFIDWYAFIGIAYITLYLFYQIATIKWLATMRKEVSVQRGKRIQLVVNALEGIRLIKMYAWEKPIEQMILHARKKELYLVKKLLNHRIWTAILFNINGRVSFFFILLPYFLLGNPAKPEILFPTIACCNIMRASVVMLTTVSSLAWTDICVGLARMQKFLTACEETVLPVNKYTETISPSENDLAIVIKNVSCSHFMKNTADDFSEGISFVAKHGDRVAIIGKVGSGKTLLLLKLLREFHSQEEYVEIKGEVAFVPHEPWIFSGTVKQNILFGLPYDETKFSSVISACALAEDINNFVNGSEAIVGESGIKLSGGQKTRINLARALYSNADVFLLDDPFSAVDVKVAHHLFHRCIQGHLKSKTVVMTTHHLHFLPNMDEIIVLEKGHIVAQGKYLELLDTGMKLPIIPDDYVNTIANVEPTEMSLPRKNHADDNQQSKEASLEIPLKRASFRKYWAYYSSDSSIATVAFCCLALYAFLGMGCASDTYLKIWSNDVRQDQLHIANLEGALFPKITDVNFLHFYLYVGTLISSVFLAALALLTCSAILQKSSKGMHERLLRRTLRAKPAYFHDWPIGNFVQRFSLDVADVDFALPVGMIDFMGYFGTALTSLILVSCENLWLILPSVIFLFILAKICVHLAKVSETFLQLESSIRCSMYSKVTATVSGLPIIHAQKKEPIMIHEFQCNINKLSSAAYCNMIASFWYFSKLLASCTINSIIIVFVVAAFIEDLSIGSIGLIIATTFMIIFTASFSIGECGNIEDKINAVERIFSYTKLETEALLHSTSENMPPPSWPNTGSLSFENVSVCYSQECLAIKEMSLTIRDKEKIGIVGRTGAGKSTLLLSILRLVEPIGKIRIDGVAINDIGLYDLRTRISVIPQDPMLFDGTIRSNLDPFGSYSDKELYSVLSDVQLLNVITALPGMLNATVSNKQSSLSAGEKQLLCIARVILKNNRILLMDEATASVDARTDSIIQQIIRHKFTNCTVLIIAHRLETIMDCDRVLVIQDGRLVEFDEPRKLMASQNGVFHDLLQYIGKFDEERMLQIANDHHQQRLSEQ